jgi:hypothetical protein
MALEDAFFSRYKDKTIYFKAKLCYYCLNRIHNDLNDLAYKNQMPWVALAPYR